MSAIRILKRQEPLGWRSCFVLLAAVLMSVGVSAMLLKLQGKPAGEAIAQLFAAAFGSRWSFEDCLVKAIPIYLCSLGVAAAFRLQVWNIGAEGQYAFGAVGAAWAALTFPDMPAPFLTAAMLAAAMVAGGLYGLVPALLKLRMGANEIIVTLMLNYIAILFLEYLVYGPWKDPLSYGFPMTREFPPAAVIGTIAGTGVNRGILLCILCGIAIWIFFKYTRPGYEMLASGESVRAARYARLPYERLVMAVMVFSGACAGWAGCIETSATIGRLQPGVMAGYGYTAIVVAWLSRLNPLFIGLASFLLAGLRVGVERLQLDYQVPAAFGQIMEGLILLTVLAGGFFTQYRIQLLFIRRKRHDL